MRRFGSRLCSSRQAADSLFRVADAITRAQSTEADAVIKALRDTRLEAPRKGEFLRELRGRDAGDRSSTPPPSR
jgi:hypothetical protein